ncbi:MAG: response regulator transcription factor, partial [Bacteroidota bacterium]
VKLCRDGISGLEKFKKDHFDLCILDVMMPKMDGFRLAELMREHQSDAPFLFLTARSLKTDRLRGYALGAEDFVCKPFDEEELLCKIKVILRRQLTVMGQTEVPVTFQIGDFHFDYSKQELQYKDQTRRITEKENEVLRLLCLNQNQILRRDEAVELIYGKKDYFLGRSFDVFISRLRKLLKSDPKVRIDNVFRVGFILNVEQD